MSTMFLYRETVQNSTLTNTINTAKCNCSLRTLLFITYLGMGSVLAVFPTQLSHVATGARSNSL